MTEMGFGPPKQFQEDDPWKAPKFVVSKVFFSTFKGIIFKFLMAQIGLKCYCNNMNKLLQQQ